MSKVLFVVHILLFSPYIIRASFIIGESFVDIFTRFDDERWEAFNNTHICYDSTCTYLAESNLRIHKGRQTSLQFSIRNNCNEPKCCLSKQIISEDVPDNLKDSIDYCTKYTGAQIISRNAFRYGSLNFISIGPRARFMEPGRFNDAVAVHGSMCVGFENDIDNDPFSTDMVIGFCFSNHNPYEVSITFQNGNVTHVKSKQLKFRTDEFKVFYRIEWKSDSISWYVNAEKVESINETYFKIPQDPIYAKVGLVPYTKWKDQNMRIEINAFLFRMRYVKKDNYKDELFVVPNSSTQFGIVLFGCLSIAWGCYGTFFIKYTSADDRVEDGAYSSLNGGT